MKHITRIILAGSLGNLIESFDMAICELLSIYMAVYLVGNVSEGLFIVFLTFLAGYLARPLGAMAMGSLSDIYGRKIVLAGSILIMGISTSLIAFIPSHNHMNNYSVIILLSLRIIQSFFCGAEYLNSSTYLIENVDASKRGSTGSWASFGTMTGMLVASILALIVYHYNHIYPEYKWLIWRIPFIVALLGSSVGLYIRLFIPESLEYILYYSDRPKPKFNELIKTSLSHIRNNKRMAFKAFLLSCLGVTTTFQIFIYGPMQTHLYGHFNDHEILISNIISLMVLLSIFPLIGKLSDKFNREKIVILASIGFMILSQPFFYSMSTTNLINYVFAQALISIPASAYYATAPVILAEMFPINLRCTILSVIYSIAASLSAGLAPVVSMILVEKTNIPSSPSILILILVSALLLLVKKSFYVAKKTQDSL
ncbi:proline/betaine transporter ProP6 [Legionella geestiana]|uniref:Proline/betaine transporter ProP6 n=1 Tax=Legionella geestiana TaxID=45065 RepID=A0A0W0TY28_9GAMM|nr:MFS transporter [Legionella geestiana]KTD00690.1 proline/betaine transporter ProP6 [Legionella geestiana]QBS11698.1 MFS transporter [Legionella geestiana]QDQ40691.1 MFS transporter [Legionella geestiana]STX53615.1 proline/betaine transporter ProP6 [Legionella geestiana]